MVQNVITVRFANGVFEPLWNRHHIESVTITFKEDLDLQGRGGYFDQFGIIRDVMQNHLTQVLSLVAMEPPASLSAEDVRDEKVKVLKSIAPLDLARLVVGQFGPDATGKKGGYLDDATVPRDSITPTYAAAVLYIENARWDGVPFILKCGKGLDERKAEIRIRFREVPGRLYRGMARSNELVLRVQPDEAIWLKLVTKRPGLQNRLLHTELDLTYKNLGHPVLYDAYERLLLDCVRGDRSLFVRNDELDASWRIFTPVLQQLERERIQPVIYPRGVRAPKEADVLLSSVGVGSTGVGSDTSNFTRTSAVANSNM
jgi:glucose-6-phosphate 1-dehydrogenase